MHERMREPFHSIMYRASTGYNDGWKEVDPEVLEKFAEEIVNECRKIIVDFDGVENYEYTMNPRSVRWECWSELRDYFNIESNENEL
jgi:hypothetical protein